MIRITTRAAHAAIKSGPLRLKQGTHAAAYDDWNYFHNRRGSYEYFRKRRSSGQLIEQLRIRLRWRTSYIDVTVSNRIIEHLTIGGERLPVARSEDSDNLDACFQIAEAALKKLVQEPPM